MRRLVLLTVCLVGPTATAYAATYGTGTFTGTVSASGRRPSQATVVIRPGKVRIERIGLDFNCAGDYRYGLPARIRTKASSRFAHVAPGPAGGSAVAKPRGTVTVRGRTFTVRGEVSLGLRAKAVRGMVEATLLKGADVVCQDTGRTFTARHR